MRWRSWRVVGFVLASWLAFAPWLAAAQEVIPIRAGQPAPADGYWICKECLTEAVKQSAALRAYMEQQDRETALREQLHQTELTGIEDRNRIEKEALEAKLKLEIDELKARIAARDKRIDNLEHPAFWKTTEFHRNLGFLLGVAVTILAHTIAF